MQQASWAERPEEDIREKEKLIAELRQQIEAHREALTRGTVPEFMRELYLTEMMDMRKEIVELQRRLHLKEQMASRARWAEGGETSSSAPGHGRLPSKSMLNMKKDTYDDVMNSLQFTTGFMLDAVGTIDVKWGGVQDWAEGSDGNTSEAQGMEEAAKGLGKVLEDVTKECGGDVASYGMVLLPINRKTDFLKIKLPRYVVKGTSDFVMQVAARGTMSQTPDPGRAVGYIELKTRAAFGDGSSTWQTHMELIAANLAAPGLKPFVVLTDTHRYKVFWQDRRKLWCTDVLDRGAAWSLIKAMLAQIRVEGGEAKVLTLPESDRQVLPPLWRAGVGLPGPAHGDVANLEDLEGLLPD